MGITGTANVNITNSAPVPVTGTVNIGTMPGLKVDTSTPLQIKAAKVYSSAILLSMPAASFADGTVYGDAVVTLPAPAVLETIAADCGSSSASHFYLGGSLEDANTALAVSSFQGSNVSSQPFITSGLAFAFPSVAPGLLSALQPTPVNIAFQDRIILTVIGDLLYQRTTPGMGCYFCLTLRELN